MADVNSKVKSQESAEVARAEMYKAATEVEEVSCFLDSYVELLLDANEFLPDDPESCRRANAQIFALLEAVRTQLARLEVVPSTLMDAIRKVAPREAA